MAPCKLFWPHPVSTSGWNNKCWLEFSEPSHAAAATKTLTGAPFWYHVKAFLCGQADQLEATGVLKSTDDAHATLADHPFEETADTVNAAHNGKATYTHDLCYNPQITFRDIEHWIQLGLLVFVWGFARLEPGQSRMITRREILEKTMQHKGIAPCKIIWPHRGYCDLFWLKFSHPDHAAAAVAILHGLVLEGGAFSAVLGDRPKDRTFTATQDGKAECDGEEKGEIEVAAQDEGCDSTTSRQS